MAVAILAAAAQYQRNAPHQLANVEQRTPRDSSDLREAIKERADLLTCSDAPRMTLARVDNGHCARASTMPRVDDACYLLTKEKVLGSVRSLECVGLKPRRSTPLPDRNLPEYPGWGFLAADCWGYARVRRRPFRPADLHPPGDPTTQRLAEDAATEWSHPASKRVRAGLRVAVYGRCIPFLLDDLPHELSVGRMRRDTIATTVTRLGHNGYDEQRRVVAVSRVVVDAAASSALSYARQAHRRALTPVAQLPNEGGPLGGALAHLFGDDDAFDGDLFNRRAGGRSVLAVHLLVVSLNLWLAVRLLARLAHTRVHSQAHAPRASQVRGIMIWNLVRRVGVVEWIRRIRPHADVTIRAARVLDWSTKPFRRLTRPLHAPVWGVIGPWLGPGPESPPQLV